MHQNPALGASKDMHDPLVPMFFPVLGAHISGSEFQYPDNNWKELTGIMGDNPSLFCHNPPLFSNKAGLTNLTTGTVPVVRWWF